MKTPVLKDELEILVKISLCLCLFQIHFLDGRSEIPSKRPLTTHTLMRQESQLPFLHT